LTLQGYEANNLALFMQAQAFLQQYITAVILNMGSVFLLQHPSPQIRQHLECLKNIDQLTPMVRLTSGPQGTPQSEEAIRWLIQAFDQLPLRAFLRSRPSA
jgi:hypothetical protein